MRLRVRLATPLWMRVLVCRQRVPHAPRVMPRPPKLPVLSVTLTLVAPPL